MPLAIQRYEICEFNSLSYSGFMGYYISMKIRKYCFITLFALLISGALFAQTPEEVEAFTPFWDANKAIFDHTHVYHCVGNEDNSLFLLNVVVEEGWKNIIYALAPDSYFKDRRIHKVWDQSVAGADVRSLVFSPFSKKFYFFACWCNESDSAANSQGLWIGTQSGKEWEPLYLTHQPTDSGLGYLIVNKTGVWLLHDIEPNWEVENGWRNSRLYQVEDDQGRFIFKIPDSVSNINFHSYWTYENPVNERLSDYNIHHEYEINFRNTDYALIIRDKDVKSWWVFDCLTQKAEKYESYDLAFEQAKKLDAKQLAKINMKEQGTPGRIAFHSLTFVCFVLSILFIITLLLHKNRRMTKTARTLKEHNKMIFDIQEKERAKISRDIHDSVVQDIRVLRLETENLVVDEGSKQRQTKIEDLATDCIVKLRNICYNLTPAELASHNEGDSSKLELISIINSLVQQFSARTHIPCIFKVAEGFEYPALEKDETQNLFRVVQESLTNIEKHSYATQVSIFIKKSGNVLFIYITDDGIGCNPDELKRRLRSKDHLGLKSMKDRMDLIGGSIEFFTAQNEGMEITIKLPLENA